MTLPPLPPTPPLPPPDGAFRRVRRRAFVRRMRLPALALSVAALAGATVSLHRPHPTASLEPVAEPSPTATETATDEPSPTPTPSPSLSASPSETLEPVVTRSPTPTPSASPVDHTTLCGNDLKPHSAGPDVTGTVVDRDGRPLERMQVWTDTCDRGLVTAAWTDAHGRFSVVCTNAFVAVAAFAWRTEVDSATAGFAFLNENTFWGTVPCGSDHRVVLPQPATIRAHLVDTAGHRVYPQEDRYLVLFYERSNANGIQERQWSSPGEFPFPGLAPGRYLVWSPQDRKQVWVTVKEGETVDVDVPTTIAPAPTATPSPTPSATASATP